MFPAACRMVDCTLKRVNKQVLDLRCEASRSLRDQRSCPPSPGQHPSGACWSQWLAGPPSCWDGHLAATCMWSVHHLAQICTLFPLEKTKKERERTNTDVSGASPPQPCTRREPLAVNTKTLLRQQSRHPRRAYRTPSASSVLLCWVTTLQSTEQHITLEQLSAPSEGLSTLMSIHECGKIQWKLGRQVPVPISS